MNLRKKKILASKVLNVGKNRICFSNDNLLEIKEAITKQDIRDLYNKGIILIKPKKGRIKIEKRKIRRGPGKIKKIINSRKRNYILMIRKLRTHLKELKNQRKINKESYWQLRKKIKNKLFKSKAGLKDYLKTIEKTENKEVNPAKKIINKKHKEKTNDNKQEKKN